MSYRYKGLTLLGFYIETAAIPSHRFRYDSEVIFSNLGHVPGANTFQVIITGCFGKYPKYFIPFFMEIIVTETVTVILKTPNDRSNTHLQTDNINQCI